jgi:predicted RNA binding protein YcfA (HicA-like mRNA interferase family)
VPKDFYPELERRLHDAGCRFVRPGKGSHEIGFSPPTGRTFAVPRTKSRHMANQILKDAGLPKAF